MIGLLVLCVVLLAVVGLLCVLSRAIGASGRPNPTTPDVAGCKRCYGRAVVTVD